MSTLAHFESPDSVASAGDGDVSYKIETLYPIASK
jgi:hypothetical protein